MQLYNRINGKELKEKLQKDEEPRVTLSFYKYYNIENTTEYRDQLFISLNKLNVFGRIYVANEGINAQISVPERLFEDFRSFIDQDKNLSSIRLNKAIDDNGKSFFKLKILIRNKIVADGLEDKSFDVTERGAHLTAEDFNKLANDPDTIIIDMRNHYETEVGHFKNALLPDVDTFRDALPVVEKMLSDHKEKKIVMYCTGGIRCEKASAWYKHKGFKNVFQLEGGIIEYARQVQEKGLENKFIGKNFVFDERLGERISDEVISVCHQCGEPCDDHTNCKNDGCHLLFIQCKSCAENFNGCCSEECREILKLPEDKQKLIRKGVNKGRQVYKKGRSEKLHFKQ